MSKFWVVTLCVIYIVSAIDLIPDIPVVGWGDDVVAGIIALRQFVSSKK